MAITFYDLTDRQTKVMAGIKIKCNDVMFSLQNILGIVAGIFTALSLLPQLVKMIKEKKATNIALPMLVILLTGLVLWIWYGILRKDWPIILTNITSLAINVLIICFRAHYRAQGRM